MKMSELTLTFFSDRSRFNKKLTGKQGYLNFHHRWNLAYIVSNSRVTNAHQGIWKEVVTA
jgi:hypothetical protein